MPFAEIVGQDRALRVIRRALGAGTLPHAWLFYGPEGVGKFKTALAVAKALVCSRAPADDFCGVCADCTRIDNEAHPDVLVVRAESKQGEREGGGAGGGGQESSGEIRIEQVRQFQRWAAVAAFQGGWRIGIFDGAERMNPYAANALLKTLEEPPPRMVLMLVSPSRGALLPTIASRCQPLHFPPAGRDEVAAALAGEVKGTPEELGLLAELAGGSIGKALNLGQDRDWVFRERRRWVEKLCSFLEARRPGLEEFVEELVRFGRIAEVLALYRTWYRDLLVYRETGEASRVNNLDLIETVSDLAGTFDPVGCVESISAIERAREALEGHRNTQLVLESLFLDLAALREGDVGAAILRDEP